MFKNLRLRPSLVLGLLFPIAVLISAWLTLSNHQQSLPKSIIKRANFPLYYPDKFPSGYSLDNNSAHLEHRIIFFSISDKNRKISVSEQQLPKTPPDLSAFVKNSPSFIKINVPAGSAVVGVDSANQSPIAILETNTTLINLSGTKDTPLDVMDKLTQSLESLPQ